MAITMARHTPTRSSHAACVDGSLGSDADPPTWWQPEARQGRDNPGLTLKRSSVEVRCNDNAFELVPRTDDKDLESRVRQGVADAGLSLDGWLVRSSRRPKATGPWIAWTESSSACDS